MKEIGIVLWFDLKRGYGFIKRKNGEDAFVHYSKIIGGDGDYRFLSKGDKVEFETFTSDRGNGVSKLQAKNVTKIED